MLSRRAAGSVLDRATARRLCLILATIGTVAAIVAFLSATGSDIVVPSADESDHRRSVRDQTENLARLRHAVDYGNVATPPSDAMPTEDDVALLRAQISVSLRTLETHAKRKAEIASARWEAEREMQRRTRRAAWAADRARRTAKDDDDDSRALFQLCAGDGRAATLLMSRVFLGLSLRPSYVGCQHESHREILHWPDQPFRDSDDFAAWRSIGERGFSGDADWEQHVRALCAKRDGEIVIRQRLVPRRHLVAQCTMLSASVSDTYIEYYSTH